MQYVNLNVVIKVKVDCHFGDQVTIIIGKRAQWNKKVNLLPVIHLQALSM